MAAVARKRTRIDRDRVSREVVERLLETAIRDGVIDPTGKSDEELEAEFLRFSPERPRSTGRAQLHHRPHADGYRIELIERA
jgi:hypothetical protein